MLDGMIPPMVPPRVNRNLLPETMPDSGHVMLCVPLGLLTVMLVPPGNGLWNTLPLVVGLMRSAMSTRAPKPLPLLAMVGSLELLALLVAMLVDLAVPSFFAAA